MPQRSPRLYEAKFYLLHVVSSVGPTAVGPEATNAATEAAWVDAATTAEPID